MAISEDQLSIWSHQGAVTQSAATYEAIRQVLNDPAAPYYDRTFDIFLQGSYGNNTNIYADSDVDVAICLTSTYYADTRSLEASEKQNYDAGWVAATYSFQNFKTDVLSWLTQKFGNGVRTGKKAIFIPGNGTRRDADVLVCAEHRSYGSKVEFVNTGICFWTSNGDQIVNYPKQHLANCTSKHQDTNKRFKPNVRILKNMRNRMKDYGLIADDLAPSYFLEGMIWNAPSQLFTHSYQQTVENYMDWLDDCESMELTCANNIHWLLREYHPVCWRQAKFDEFRAAAKQFWNQPNH